MSLNDDFSFVRFLKVVKTLYEASTFTQLGKTVGSALTKPGVGGNDHGEEESATYNTLTTTTDKEEENTQADTHQAPQSSLLTMLAACTSPTDNDCGTNVLKDARDKDSAGRKSSQDRELATVDTRDTRTPSSLLEQVINCTYVHGDDPYSDDDTYHSKGSYDDATLGDSTFDSMTDDGYESSRRGRGRSRRRRRV